MGRKREKALPIGDAVRQLLLREVVGLLEQKENELIKQYKWWGKLGDMALDDWAAFSKARREMGGAQYDDPPEGWTQADLEKYALGNVHGRECETGNQSGDFRVCAWFLKRALEPMERYGHRNGFPGKDDIAWHQEQTLCGAWFMRVSVEGEKGVAMPFMTGLWLDAKERVVRRSGKRVVRLTEKDRASTVSAMPIDINGLPAPWKAATPAE